MTDIDHLTFIRRAEVTIAEYVNSYSPFEWDPSEFGKEAEAVVSDMGSMAIVYGHTIDRETAVNEVTMGLVGKGTFTPGRAWEVAQKLIDELGAEMLFLQEEE